MNLNLILCGHLVWMERKYQCQSYSKWFRDADPTSVEWKPQDMAAILFLESNRLWTTHSGYSLPEIKEI